jgi:lipoprotein NlpI
MIALAWLAWAGGCAARADAPPDTSAAELRRQAADAGRQRKTDDALRLAGQAIAAAPKEPDGYALRAELYAVAGDHQKAIADLDRLIELDPNRADAYDQRGAQQFMLGNIEESILDFDRYLRLKPDQEPWHWQRGISYYYAGQFDKGRKQFEGYQTVDDNDVENAVWRALCMARASDLATAQRDMLKVKHDPRVPMTEIYALFAGRAKPEDVLAAAQAGSPKPDDLNSRLFYAHLYLGLYYEAAGDAALARQHLTKAADEHKIGHYMWHVADVHARRLKAAATP